MGVYVIEITWGQLRDNDLNPALNKLATAHLELKTTIKILGIMKAIEKEWNKSEEVRVDFMSKLGVQSADKRSYGPKKGQEKEWDDRYKEFQAVKAKIRYPKIKLDEVKNLPLTAVDLAKLEPLIEGIEYEEETPSDNNKRAKK